MHELISAFSFQMHACARRVHESGRLAKMLGGFPDNANCILFFFQGVFVGTWYKPRQFFSLLFSDASYYQGLW